MHEWRAFHSRTTHGFGDLVLNLSSKKKLKRYLWSRFSFRNLEKYGMWERMGRPKFINFYCGTVAVPSAAQAGPRALIPKITAGCER